MRLVYSHPDSAIVHLLRNELERHGIEAAVRGEHLAAVGGGGASPLEAWPGLWVADGPQLPLAIEVVRAFVDASPVEGEPWTCAQCGESVEPAFGACWSYGAERPASVA